MLAGIEPSVLWKLLWKGKKRKETFEGKPPSLSCNQPTVPLLGNVQAVLSDRPSWMFFSGPGCWKKGHRNVPREVGLFLASGVFGSFAVQPGDPKGKADVAFELSSLPLQRREVRPPRAIHSSDVSTRSPPLNKHADGASSICSASVVSQEENPTDLLSEIASEVGGRL